MKSKLCIAVPSLYHASVHIFQEMKMTYQVFYFYKYHNDSVNKKYSRSQVFHMFIDMCLHQCVRDYALIITHYHTLATKEIIEMLERYYINEENLGNLLCIDKFSKELLHEKNKESKIEMPKAVQISLF